MAKKLLKVAAGINLVIGGIVLLFSLLIINVNFLAFFGTTGIVIAGIRLVIGATFLNVAGKDGADFIKGKTYVLIASIISILTGHVITFILGLIAYSDMYGNIPIGEIKVKKELTEEEKAQKRLKNLLALGCALVLLAGIIFAMTTWTTLSGAGKTVALVIATFIFFGLSYLAENKFGLKSSSVTYYILANAFSIVTFISAGYFNIFGEWFSLNGEGSELYKAFLFALIGGLTYLSYLKYNRKNLFYIIDLAVLMLVVSLLSYFNFGTDVILFSIILIVAIFAIIKSENEILKKANNLGNILLPIVSFILFTNITSMKLEDRMIFNLLSFGIAFVTIYYLAIINKEIFYEIFAPIFTTATAFSLCAVMGADSKIMLLQLMLIAVIIYSVGYYKREQKWLFTTTLITCDLALLYIFIDALGLEYNYYAVAAALALLGTSFTVLVSRKFSEYHFEKILEPIKVVLLAYALYKLIYKFAYTEEWLFAALTGLILSIICVFRKDLMKKIYFIGAVLVAAWALLSSMDAVFSPIVQVLSVVSLSVLLGVTFFAKEVKFRRCKELIYGLLILAIAIASLSIFAHFELKLVGIILLAIIYSILLILFKNNNIFRCFTIVALLIPYINILPISIWNDNVNYILYSLPWLALIFTYTRGLLASASLKAVNAIEIVVLSIWYLAVSSEVALEVAIFIGIISFVAILVGYKSDKWISLYYTGVAFLILNTLIQLQEFWTSVPMWAYILVAGLILIGIVTYKEYLRINKKENLEKIEVEVVNETVMQPVKQPIDTRTVVIGSIFYVIFMLVGFGL